MYCQEFFKDVSAQNVPTHRFLLNLPCSKVKANFCQTVKKHIGGHWMRFQNCRPCFDWKTTWKRLEKEYNTYWTCPSTFEENFGPTPYPRVKRRDICKLLHTNFSIFFFIKMGKIHKGSVLWKEKRGHWPSNGVNCTWSYCIWCQAQYLLVFFLTTRVWWMI